MSSSSIAHAWTILCDRVVTDTDTNNLVVYTLEQLTFPPIQIPEGKKGILIPARLEIVSLWYRKVLAVTGKTQARVRLFNPNNDEIGSTEMSIDLGEKPRMRTRVEFRSIPASRPGLYCFVVEQMIDKDWTEAARVPLQIVMEQLPTQVRSVAAEPRQQTSERKKFSRRKEPARSAKKLPQRGRAASKK